MSGESNIPCAGLDESISSFSPSSFGSDDNNFALKYQKEHEKARKLEDKLAGYRTVVQQFPKLQADITLLKRRNEEHEKELAQYRTKDAEHQKRIFLLETLVLNTQQGKQGLTELDVSRSRASTPHSSPSFEIIGKSPCSGSVERNTHSFRMQEARSPSRPANVETVAHDPSSPHRNIKLSSPSKEVPQYSAKYESATTSSVAGPPKNTLGLLRGFSTNFVTSEQNSHYSASNQLNSYPAVKGSISILAFATGNKKPVWQMEQEAVLKRSESSETTHQGPPIIAASTQAAQNWGNSVFSLQTSNRATSAVDLDTFVPAGLADTGTKPKEWSPLNTLTPQYRAHTDVSLVKQCDSMAVQLGNQIPVKTSQNLGYDLFGGPGTISPRPHHSFLQLNNLNIGKMVESSNENEPLIDITSSNDLMKFPSLNTNSPSPVSEQNKVTRTASPIYVQSYGAVVFPTEEQPHLASQVESMAAVLEKNDSPVGMSDMLYTFAETAKKMEARLSEYEALIQQQRLKIHQLQSVPTLNQGEENARLREENSTLKSENETLLEFIGALKESKGNDVEPGWVSVLATQSSTDPVRAHYPDSPIMKKIESLSNINAKLFRANKDWHNKWEVLRQQTQEEKADLEARVKSLEAIIKSLKDSIATLEKELQNQNISVQELMKANDSVEEEKSALQRLRAVSWVDDGISVQELMKANDSVEEEKSALQRLSEAHFAELQSLKTEVNDLTRSKRMLESELTSMKNLSRNRDSQQTTGNRELHTEIGLLKQQLTVFAEDFEKERKDRVLAESKADKYRKERDQIKLSLETKLKKISVQLRAQENDLRAKARQNADLLYQVDDLKLKLQREQRRSALIAPSSCSYQPPPASYQGPISLAYSSGLNDHMINHSIGAAVNHRFASSSHASQGLPHQSSPEHLPGAWKCRHCTYINYPNRSVCDICGYSSTSGESLPIPESGRNELQSRGEERRYRDAEDIVVDTQ